MFGQEVELVRASRVSHQKTHGNTINARQRQHWSFMTVLYLGIHYAGILHAMYTWMAKQLMLCRLADSHTQHQDLVYVYSHAIHTFPVIDGM
ncbi:hypothetical protein BDR06DRAFT_964496 [Suillus hirtellus]|nr:hypothetical protein BDR06DRAFT_964496 [Suillus hirtellus]